MEAKADEIERAKSRVISGDLQKHLNRVSEIRCVRGQDRGADQEDSGPDGGEQRSQDRGR